MEKLIDPVSLKAKGLPMTLRLRAIREGKFIKKIVWDKEGGYPEQSWGYEQFTLRPYTLGYGCDGTTDANIHWIAINMCGQVGLDYFELYEEAYEDWPEGDRTWLRRFDFSRTADETVLPEADEKSFRLLLSDLDAINNRSISDLLYIRLEEIDFNVNSYWDDETADIDEEMEVAA